MVYLISTYDRPYLDSKNYGFRSTYKLKTSKSNLFQSCLFPFFIYTWCKRRDKPTLVCCGSFWMMTSVLNLQTWEALMPMCTPLLPSVGNNMQEPYYSTLFWNPVLQSGFISFIGPPLLKPFEIQISSQHPFSSSWAFRRWFRTWTSILRSPTVLFSDHTGYNFPGFNLNVVCFYIPKGYSIPSFGESTRNMQYFYAGGGQANPSLPYLNLGMIIFWHPRWITKNILVGSRMCFLLVRYLDLHASCRNNSVKPEFKNLASSWFNQGVPEWLFATKMVTHKCPNSEVGSSQRENWGPFGRPYQPSSRQACRARGMQDLWCELWAGGKGPVLCDSMVQQDRNRWPIWLSRKWRFPKIGLPLNHHPNF